jgi:hypothetical protein
MLFEEILNLYSETSDYRIQAEKDYKESVTKTWYSIIPTLTAKIEIYKEQEEKLRKILVNNFNSEIVEEISNAEAEYQYQQERCKAMWNDYGSELAGDFNQSEVLAQIKLGKLTKILIEDKDYWKTK